MKKVLFFAILACMVISTQVYALDPMTIPPFTAASRLLPSPVSQDVSPGAIWQSYAMGIVIKNFHHKRFSLSVTPPDLGLTTTVPFTSQADFEISYDGGATYTFCRAPVSASMKITCYSDSGGVAKYNTEMLQMDIPDLPASVRLRESPTKASIGGIAIETLPSDYKIHSFFDIYTEISLDGGMSWHSSTVGAGRLEAKTMAPSHLFPTSTIPPLCGQYADSASEFAKYGVGSLVVKNVVIRNFTSTFSLPPSGGSDTHSYSAVTDMMISTDGGITFTPNTAPTNITVYTAWNQTDGTATYYNTEMLQLDINSGTMPILIRESPTKASTGRLSQHGPVGGKYDVESFFDIYTEISVDGGGTWQSTVTGATTVGLMANPLNITCPPNITVDTTDPGGTAVTFTVTATGGCPPVNVTCNPPSGSVFPIGTTTVNCEATDSCGQSASCSFTVTVNRTSKPHFFTTNLLPPANGMYNTGLGDLFASYPLGVIIRNWSNRAFSASVWPPPPGGRPITHSFDSTAEFEISFDGGANFQSVTASVANTIQISYSGNSGGLEKYNVEVTRMDAVGLGMFLLRESPTLTSSGQANIRTVTGGYQIGSFFDIYTEISLDNGLSWWPSVGFGSVVLSIDPSTIPPMFAPSTKLPSPVSQDVSTNPVWQSYASGIIFKDVQCKRFSDWIDPPALGVTTTFTYDAQVDYLFSTDGGLKFSPGRVPATLTVRTYHSRDFNGRATYETELLQMDAAGGDLPVNMRLRESPTRASEGAVKIHAFEDGYRIRSFFDIFTEITFDGGQTWQPASQAGHVEAQAIAPSNPFPTPNLQPETGQYVHDEEWFAYYALGIALKDVVVNKFSASVPPPPPGLTVTHTCDTMVDMMISTDGGVTFTPVVTIATITFQITRRLGGDGITEYYDTEMLQLNISGGGLPPTIRFRESPTRASLGRTSERSLLGGDYNIESFFDVFTELSLDGGTSWWPTTTGPVTITLVPIPCNRCSDFDNSGVTDLSDFAEMARNWLWTGSVGDRYNIADLNCNGSVAVLDLILFAQNWLDSCP